MKKSFFENKQKLFLLFFSIAFLSIAVRLLTAYNFDQSALLYVGIPFLTSLILIKVRPSNDTSSWKRYYLNRLIDAFIIMLGSSIVLFEGFVCVVMFMPIYLILLLIMFFLDAKDRRGKRNGRGTLKIHIFPLLIFMSAFEGVSPALSIDRSEQVSATRVVDRSIEDIKHNMAEPIDLQKSRSWLLALFPMPYEVKAGSITQCALHEIRFEYYRWFFTNRHEGRMLLEMSEVGETHIKTTFLEDTSYIANYLNLKGTEINMSPVGAKQTRVTLTINYDRTLDPYWYFGPIQHYGVSRMADFLIVEIMAREVS